MAHETSFATILSDRLHSMHCREWRRRRRRHFRKCFCTYHFSRVEFIQVLAVVRWLSMAIDLIPKTNQNITP